jgi:hypothetical protein
LAVGICRGQFATKHDCGNARLAAHPENKKQSAVSGGQHSPSFTYVRVFGFIGSHRGKYSLVLRVSRPPKSQFEVRRLP